MLLLIKHCYIIVPIPSTTLVVLQTPLICTYLSCKKKGIFLFAREGKAWFFLETNFWYCVLILYLHFQHSIGAANPIPIMRSIWCEDLTLLLVMSPSWAGSSHSLSWGISSSVLLGSARLVAFSSELLFSAWRAFFCHSFFSYFICIFRRQGTLFSPFFVVHNTFPSKKVWFFWFSSKTK